MAAERTYILKALTDIWTGDAERRGDRLIATGLLGSIRWWFEVLVRGLGGSACDPTLDGNRCPDPRKQPHEEGHHCAVCELFGCTGWARKFRFEVLDANDQPKASQIRKNEAFKLRFTELRPIRKEEWALLDLTLRLTADYGAIGGKTVLKPSDEPSRMNKPNHVDYGLVAVVQAAGLSRLPLDALRTYVGAPQWRRVDDSGVGWASIANFWFVGARYLARQNNNTSTFNRVVGRCEPKAQAQQTVQGASAAPNRWLAGRQRESKKVFSFKEPEEARRTFGFVNPPAIGFDDMRQRLRQVWRGFQDSEFLTGDQILQDLLKPGSGGSP
ncbi:MAG TPA: type III-B CRISPR module RAMP protein Cmr1 [Burkholderiales bacterium]|nr:type III-B CRISPR module RAMP protein Cmr1 [Burkholderiales bacterium]